MEKMAWDGLKWGQEDFFPTNPDLAGILGRTDLEFENFHFFHVVDQKNLDFQVPRFPKFGLGRAGPGLDLGGGGEMLASHLWVYLMFRQLIILAITTSHHIC